MESYSPHSLIRYAAKPWNKFINMANQRYISEELFDLLDNLLRYDHQERLTAKEAMNHPFFGMLSLGGSLR